jgi:hypothetical protein
MKRDMETPIRLSRGRPGIDKFWAVDCVIINAAEELVRAGRGGFRTPSGAIREFVRRVWSGDYWAVLTVLAAANAHFLDDMLKERRVVVDVCGKRVVVDDLDLFRPQAIGASEEAVVWRVRRRLKAIIRRRGGVVWTSKPLIRSPLSGLLDKRRGPRRAFDRI